MEVNVADVAELVDARDLKFPAAPEPATLSCKTDNANTIENDAIRLDLQNASGAKNYRAGLTAEREVADDCTS